MDAYDVLQRIKDNSPSWERMVPEPVAAAIKRRRLFGYTGDATSNQGSAKPPARLDVSDPLAGLA